MRISIFGLGYVGAVSAACLARLGHEVVGVDTDVRKLEFIREGKSPILEEGLGELIAEVVASGSLRVTDSSEVAIRDTDLSIVCVGTPSTWQGALCTDHLEKVATEIGDAIKRKASFHSVMIRSTVLPGTTADLVIPALERATGGTVGEAFGISANPEFMREGTAVADFHDPPFTIIGTDSSGEYERVRAMYGSLVGPVVHSSIETAETLKYACNAFHAVKITLANEIGILCKEVEVDARQVMEVLCQDSKLNISSRYLRPGFAFGGSCLPKDLRALTSLGRRKGRPLMMLEAVRESNREQIEQTVKRIMAIGSRKISLMGLSFKEGTDDLRESPLVELAQMLFGKGYELRIFDPHVEYASLYGSNRTYIDNEIPHLKKVLATADEVLEHGQVLVFGHSGPHVRALLPRIRADQTIFDLVGITGAAETSAAYHGLYW